MRSLIVVSVLAFLVALTLFALRGPGLIERGRIAHRDLQGRARTTLGVLGEVAPLSLPQVEALADRRRQLAEQVGQRTSILVDGVFPAPTPALQEVLRTTRFGALDRGMPLREEVLARAAADPRVEAALARVLDLAHASGIDQLETLVFEKDAALVPVEGIPRLVALDFEMVLVSETPELLEFVERFVPGSGEPVLTIRSASLRRIEPGLWEQSAAGLLSPPARLALAVSALFGNAAGRLAEGRR